MELSGLTFPNQYMSVKLQALDELMGTNGLHALLNSADLKDWTNNPPPPNADREIDYAHIAAIIQALRDLYGEKGSYSLLRPASKKIFHEMWSTDVAFTNLADEASKTLDPSEQLSIALQTFSELLNRDTDLQSTVEEKDNGLHFTLGECPFCWGVKGKDGTCYAFIGLLEQVAHLVLSEPIDVREISCVSSGDPSCIFDIKRSS